MLAFERFIALESATGWLRFRDAVLRQRQEFVDLLRTLRAEHKRVVGYGAAAKFMTMLNYCGIGRDLIAAVGDANPRKQGLLCPGVRIPVVSPQQLMDLKPDFIVIGAWNFKDEMIRQLRERHDYKGAFIVPLPLPSIERQDAT